MAGNTLPIFSKVGVIGFISQITAASTDHLGGGAVQLVLVDPTNGGRVDSIVAMPLGTNVASVLRIWINNGAVFTTTTNNVLWNEVSLPATTITEVAAQVQIVITANLVLPPGYRLGIAIGTAVAAGWSVQALAGSY